MGQLLKGTWTDDWIDTSSKDGAYVRPKSRFRDWVSDDGSSDFPAEAGRYHLYVSLACPWAHRTLIFRKLKELEKVIGLSVVDPFMGSEGWMFSTGPGCIPDTVNNARFLHELYTRARPDFTGRVTVPVLWDKKTDTLVNNESSEIIRMLNSAFNAFGRADLDYYPLELRTDIERINDFIYPNINNGVYRCGFATTQASYALAFRELFNALDLLDERLDKQPYLVGGQITEADWRLFTTLVRFDAVYVGHFKCNKKRIADYPHLTRYLKDLCSEPGVAETVNMDHIKRHYYQSHLTVNPTGITPAGPELHLPGVDSASL